jgi:hypothetical protein
MPSKTAPRAKDRARRDSKREAPRPTSKNTRPRGNPETDRHELERAQERMEAVLGH